MSSSEPTTSSELTQIFTTVDAMAKIRDRIFGATPELCNYQGSVTHWLQFSTTTVQIESGVDYVVVSGSSADLFAGTLPEKIYINMTDTDVIQFNYNSTSANVVASSVEASPPILKLPAAEIKKYRDSNYLLTRIDSGDENNQEILFISNGTLTTMFPDVFFREISAFVASEGYDSAAGTIAETGWYIGMMSEIDLLTDVFQDQELVTNSSVDLIAATTPGLVETSTLPPLIEWATDLEFIHTFEDGSTAPTELLIDFGSFPALQFKASEADHVVVYKMDDNDTLVLGAGQMPIIDEPEKTTVTLTRIAVNLNWDVIII